MRFPNFILFSSLSIFGSAIPAADKSIHYVDPGCTGVGAQSCNAVPWCRIHSAKGDLFNSGGGILSGRDFSSERGGFLSGRDVSESDLKSATEELDVDWKRVHFPRSIRCGILSGEINELLSNQFTLVGGVAYDLVVDYPHEGATGGTIAVIAGIVRVDGNFVKRIAAHPTGGGGIRFTFRALPEAEWYQTVFRPDSVATTLVNYYVLEHQDVVHDEK